MSIKSKRNEYIGKKYVNKYGEEVEVVEYNSNKDVSIKYGNGYIAHTQMSNLRQGRFSSPYAKRYCGVGFLGEGAYSPTVKGEKTKAYKAWCSMMERCYGKGSTLNKRGYASHVSDSWHCFQNFAKWYEDNYYEVDGEKMCVDKDLLIKGNTLYSEETCCIVPNSINTLLLGSDSARGEYPIGVSHREGHGYYARCNVDGSCVRIGVYINPKSAFLAYKKFKEQAIKDKVTSMKDLLPNEVVDALMRYEVEETD